MKQIGISLTENGAMYPHASVCGLMFSHPASEYFSVGKIGEDQLEDYARRRGKSIGRNAKVPGSQSAIIFRSTCDFSPFRTTN